MKGSVLILACGAIARELVELRRLNGWSQLSVRCLPAALHNRPERIVSALREMIEANLTSYDQLFVAYADCGTGGGIDRLLQEYGIERLPGAHCYEFFTGHDVFYQLAASEPATFYLTDFLVRHFDRLVKLGLGLDRHPELLPRYFGNYRRLVYLAQEESPELQRQARAQAKFLGLDFHLHCTGFAPLNSVLNEQIVQWQS